MTAVATAHGPRPVVVIGGGIAGLAAAWTLREAGVPVLVLEQDARVGGVIRSERSDGGDFLAELGPTSMMETPDLTRLIDALSLQEHRVRPDASSARRYIVRDGRMVALPTAPLALVTSRALSTRGKLRLLAEPFVPRAAESAPEESLAQLVRRRFGAEVLEYFVDPFASGVYAGDVTRLSSRHAMRPLRQLELAHGSVLAGAVRQMWRGRRARGTGAGATRPAMCSFLDGLSTLPLSLGASLGEQVRTRTRAVSLRATRNGWEIGCLQDGIAGAEVLEASAVVLALPAHALHAVEMPAALRQSVDPLTRVRFASVATVSIGLRRSDVVHPLDGFGVLAPTLERQPVLGALFNSTLFAGRAPDNSVLLTAFVGGAANPGALERDDAELVEAVMRGLRPLLGITGAARYTRVTRWTRGIPQYELGYDRVLGAVAATEQAHAGLAFAGSSVTGVSIGDCVTGGMAAARRVLSRPAPYASPAPAVL